MNKIHLDAYLILCLIMGFYSCQPKTTVEEKDPRQEIALEIEQHLREQVLQKWFPRVVDEEMGGFYSDFSYKWDLDGPQNKMIVSQSRHIWSASRAAEFYPDNPIFPQIAEHGFQFLRDKMWDSEHGGFYDLVDRSGKVLSPQDGPLTKKAYGNSFAIYGLAAYYKLSQKPEVLDLAKETFMWLEKHSHDSVYGGYYQFLLEDGTALVEGVGTTPPKDQNNSIHLLEAFTELYHVWPDDLLRERLEELFLLIRDTMTGDMGYLRLFFQPDWTPVSYRDSTQEVREQFYGLDHVSWGHDVETAYLLLEAAEALGIGDDPLTHRKAKKMVDHALATGWDEESGSLFDRGYYFAGVDSLTIIDKRKTWWSIAETMNTLLIMSDLYPDDPNDYYGKFEKIWKYIKTYMIDQEYGGWYRAGLDTEPEYKTASKGGIWKTSYHNQRSLMNCIIRLQNEGAVAH